MRKLSPGEIQLPKFMFLKNVLIGIKIHAAGSHQILLFPPQKCHSFPHSHCIWSSLCFFFFFWPRRAASGILVPQPEIETGPLAGKVQSPLDHQGTPLVISYLIL